MRLTALRQGGARGRRPLARRSATRSPAGDSAGGAGGGVALRGERDTGDGERGAAVVETILVLPLLLGTLLASMAFGMGAIAQAVVTNAARDSARLAAIECGQGDANWYADAQAAAAAALGDGLRVGALSADPRRYGSWSFQASCGTPGQVGGAATVQLVYDEINLFPPIASLLAPGAGPGGRVFRLQAAAVFPEE